MEFLARRMQAGFNVEGWTAAVTMHYRQKRN